MGRYKPSRSSRNHGENNVIYSGFTGVYVTVGQWFDGSQAYNSPDELNMTEVDTDGPYNLNVTAV
jgi:hypothetical protein